MTGTLSETSFETAANPWLKPMVSEALQNHDKTMLDETIKTMPKPLENPLETKTKPSAETIETTLYRERRMVSRSSQTLLFHLLLPAAALRRGCAAHGRSLGPVRLLLARSSFFGSPLRRSQYQDITEVTQ